MKRKRSPAGKPVLAKGRTVVGIDVGKRKHAATALTPQGELVAQLASFPNTRAGIDLLEKEVLRKAGAPGKVLVAMEATGHYWMCLYYELQRRGYEGVVLNPLQTNAHSRSQIRKNYNDRIDSAGIARLVLAGEARATRVPDEKTAELRLWVRHRQRLLRAAGNMERFAHTLVDRVFPEYADVLSKPFLTSGQELIRQIGLAPSQLVAQKDQVREVLRAASRKKIAPETIDLLLQVAQQSIGTRQAENVATRQLVLAFDYLASLREQIAAIEEELERRAQELQSPLFSLGITAKLVAVIHAESDPIQDFRSADQYVAYTGLDPSSRRSGDTINRRGKISKRGSPTLRRALYLAAFVVTRKHACFRRLYQRHRRQGKGHSNALVVVARHLARVVWRLLTDRRQFSKRPPKHNFPSPRRKPK
ncbi:MAG TPA: IS110 family transposase [Phycisphaerales bacterium]|nr:IS110 family transposase [Phycisphaerales bacterium]